MKVTVNNQDKKEVIDWNKVQLVISDDDDNDFIVLVTSDTNESIFSGITLYDNIKSNFYAKQSFKPFHGSITLQND